MRVAVVIPCYNHARYIGAAIESVLGQTRPPDRFLVIDDGSRDESVEVIRRYAARGVECVAQANQGAHNTLNRLISETARDCDVIAILNSDDIFEPARLERLLPALAGDCDVVSSRVRMIDTDGSALAEDAPRAKWLRAVNSLSGAPELDLAEWLGVANFAVSTSNIVARAGFLLANPFRAYRYIHDYYLLATAAIRGRLGYVDEPLLLYRAHDANTIQTQPAPLIREMQRMHLELYRQFAGELRADAALRSRLAAFERASWNSISSFHGGIHQMLLAELIVGESEARIAELTAGLELPEMERFPNAEILSAFDGSAPLFAASATGERLAELRRSRTAAKEETAAWKEMNRLRLALGKSGWVALGRLLGQGRAWSGNDGGSATEKLERLRASIETCPWLGFGARLGLWRKLD